MGQRADEVGRRTEDGTTLWSGDPAALSTEVDSSVAVPAPDGGDEIDERVNEIERTRAELSGTIDALQERLAPEHLVEDAKEAFREGTIRKAERIMTEVEDTARSMRTTLSEMIQENPVPAAVAGIGLTWLFMQSRGRSRSAASHSANRYSDQPYHFRPERQSERDLRATVGQAQDKAEDMIGQARDAAGQVIDDAGDLASDASEKAARLAAGARSRAREAGSSLRGSVERVPGGFERLLQESPLAVGAVALGVGAAVGLAFPSTSRERELMGEARESFMEKAQQAAQDAQHRIQEVGEQVQQNLKSEADASQPAHQEPSKPEARPHDATQPVHDETREAETRPYGERLAS